MGSLFGFVDSTGNEKKPDDSEKKNAMNKRDTTSLVNFNVGGTPYTISRSLLEQHPNTMLFSIVSQAWQKDDGNQDHDNEPIFIERDGRRFRYVLDYMRDGRVSLPLGSQGDSVSKASLVEELIYFGFQEISPKSITADLPLYDIPKYAILMAEDFKTEQAKAIRQREELNVTIACRAVAYACAVRSLNQGGHIMRFSIILDPKQDPKQFKPRNVESNLDYQVVLAVRKTSLSSQEDQLNTFLAKFGLRASDYIEHSGRVVENGRSVFKVNSVGLQIHSYSAQI